MNTLLMDGFAEPVNMFKYNSELPSFSQHQNSIIIYHTNDQDDVGSIKILGDHHASWKNSNDDATNIIAGPYSGFNPDGDIDEASDDCLKFISEIPMEEDLDDQTGFLHDHTALQATEKSLYDALGETFPASSDEYLSSVGQNTDSPDDNCHQSCRNSNSYDLGMHEEVVSSSTSLNSDSFSYGYSDRLSEAVIKGLADSSASMSIPLSSELIDDHEARFDWFKEASQHAQNGCCNCSNSDGDLLIDHKNDSVNGFRNEGDNNKSRGKKNHTRYDADDEEQERRNKHLAISNEEYVQMEQYDDVLLCKEDGNGNMCFLCHQDGSSDDGEKDSKGSKRKRTRRKKQTSEGEVVDLWSLLIQCAQAVASFDLRNANEQLKQIRLHSSQFGDSIERVDYYFANALEARLAGTGWQQYRKSTVQSLRTSEVLKAYKEQVSAIPFRRASYFLAREAITKLAESATRVHIIDFGVFYGFQWPSLIQKLSKRTGGPPMLRITGIDNPDSGFRPAQRVEETGRRLAGYCERFKVPFQYQAIAKNWEDITLEDINIERDELVVVNCLYMSEKLLDETVEDNNPRDGFLRFIRKLNPDLFIHGVVTGTFNSPFFVTRFKEALFHYSSIFDMFEATLPCESNERLLVENLLYGKDALNVIACEGTERVARPETYRQWQVRSQKAGFRKLRLDHEVVERMKAHVKMNHHKDFIIDQDSHWMLQGWKGRILYAVSCWRSA
uniref:GRAS family transcription factor n=1 Tax=Sesuvium portulacastrum TaxID=221166 RepID=A0A2I7ZAT6_SESPO|nr:GRAS family transcription factor [Sesuvium portulacastrum]